MMKKKTTEMPVEEYIQNLEKDIKRLEIRSLMEKDAAKRASINKSIEKRAKTVKTLRKLWSKNGVEYATLEHTEEDDEE